VAVIRPPPSLRRRLGAERHTGKLARIHSQVRAVLVGEQYAIARPVRPSFFTLRLSKLRITFSLRAHAPRVSPRVGPANGVLPLRHRGGVLEARYGRANAARSLRSRVVMSSPLRRLLVQDSYKANVRTTHCGQNKRVPVVRPRALPSASRRQYGLCRAPAPRDHRI
jgi:hypothetical protein